jgi:tetratricopeptide (TPR) repeat protein
MNRPNTGGQVIRPSNQVNRPNINTGNQVNRPNINTGNQVNRPNINTGNQVNRPNINTGNQVNRPNINTGNQVNRPNINTGTQVNRPTWNNNTFNRNNVINNAGNRTVNVNNQQASFNRIGGYNAYQGNWAGAGWHRGYWNNWNYRPVAWTAAGLGTGVAGSWLLSGGENYVYSNPYYVASPNITVQGLDYSQPIEVPAPPVDVAPEQDGEPPPEPEPPAVPDDVNRNVDAARAAFKGADYARAQALLEKAIAELPNDTTLHEFRALTLFAQEKYKDAAAGVYAVLSVGPGWDWDTMKSFYADTSLYTGQLRTLERYVKDNPKYPEGHFLLAYHYLVLNQTDAAVKQLQEELKLVPTDKLTPQLIKAFTPANGGADRPAPQAP